MPETTTRCHGCGQTVEVESDGFLTQHKRPVLILGTPTVRRGRTIRHGIETGTYPMRCSASGTRRQPVPSSL